MAVSSTFNQLGQYANSPGCRAYCYTELAVSSLAVAVTVASTYFTYPRRNDQAELAWVAWLNIKTVYLRTVTHLSTNSTMLPLSQTATKPIQKPDGNKIKTQVQLHICLCNVGTAKRMSAVATA